ATRLPAAGIDNDGLALSPFHPPHFGISDRQCCNAHPTGRPPTDRRGERTPTSWISARVDANPANAPVSIALAAREFALHCRSAHPSSNARPEQRPVVVDRPTPVWARDRLARAEGSPHHPQPFCRGPFPASRAVPAR